MNEKFNKQVKLFNTMELPFWRELLHECGYTYRVTNLSDYSGVEILIEWCEAA